MARIEMTGDFDWKVPGAKSHTLVALKAGRAYTVRRECADAAVAAGKGREVDAPGSGDDGSGRAATKGSAA